MQSLPDTVIGDERWHILLSMTLGLQAVCASSLSTWWSACVWCYLSLLVAPVSEHLNVANPFRLQLRVLRTSLRLPAGRRRWWSSPTAHYDGPRHRNPQLAPTIAHARTLSLFSELGYPPHPYLRCRAK